VLTAQVLDYLFKSDDSGSKAPSSTVTYHQNPYGFQTLLSCLMINSDEELILDFQRFKNKYQSLSIREEPIEEEVFTNVEKKRETGLVRVQARVRGYLVRKELEIVHENRLD